MNTKKVFGSSVVGTFRVATSRGTTVTEVEAEILNAIEFHLEGMRDMAFVFLHLPVGASMSRWRRN